MMRKLIFVVCLAASTVEARQLRPARLAPSPFADTEVSTNVACAFDDPALDAWRLSLALVGTPSNNVEVALGKDADGDGRLSCGEELVVLAWDCGAWIALADGREVEPLVSGPDTNGVVLAALSAARRGEESDRLWDSSWNLLRITARGVDAPLECVRLEMHLVGTKVMFR